MSDWQQVWPKMGIDTPDTLTVTESLSLKEPTPKRQYPGALVVVEGIDGSGKSTQLYLLKRWLEIGGYRIHFTEWNSSPLVKSATRRGKQRRLLTPTTFSLLHAADFADRCERQIMPLLHGGYLVLADRYIYTAFARDAETRGDVTRPSTRSLVTSRYKLDLPERRGVSGKRTTGLEPATFGLGSQRSTN